MTITQQKWYPIAGGLLAGGAYLICHRLLGWQIPTTMPNLFAAVINVCAIAIGFLGTAQSILVSMEDRQVMLQLKDSGMLAHISNFVMQGIVWSFWLAALSAVLMMVDWSALTSAAINNPLPAPGSTTVASASPPAWVSPLLGVWTFLLVTAALAYYRIISLFGRILKVGSVVAAA